MSARIAQKSTIFVLGAHRRHGRNKGFDLAFKADFAQGKRLVSRVSPIWMLQRLKRRQPGRGDGHRGFRHVSLEAAKPGGIGARHPRAADCARA